MTHSCPNFWCKSTSVAKDGFYFRKSDSRYIRRFKCKSCGRRFSQTTSTLEFGHKKRRVNYQVWKLMCSGVSMRRTAKILCINKITVARKVVYLAKKCREKNRKLLNLFKQEPLEHVQFDDLITIEHTKMKPVSISIAVDCDSLKILGMRVSQIPAFGLLAEKSLRKYGKRKSTHYKKLIELFEQIKDSISPSAIFESDKHKTYPHVLKRFFPNAQHLQYKGGRGAIVGQGELKKLEYDPLYAINHTCAMLRANINRLIRKTWCTTKSPEMLQNHLDMYMCFHNTILKV